MENLSKNKATITTYAQDETKAFAKNLAQHLEPGDVVLLKGCLGAGKTQFAQGVGAGLSIKEPITSPTFNILLEYHSGVLSLNHFDLYRLNSPDELEDIAFYEVVYSDGVSVIEWWDKFPGCMPDEYLSVEIALGESAGTSKNTSASANLTHARTITLQAVGKRYEKLLAEL